jgi:hypothetical protein
MLRGFRWLALGAVILTAAFVAPSIALADGCGTSAASIYSECSTDASGHHHSTSGTTTTTPTPTPYGGTAPVVIPPVVTKHATTKTRKDQKIVTKFVKNPGLDSVDRIKPLLVASPANSSSLGSAFDLGTGPTILLVLLFGTVLASLGTGGVRAWRNRHHA